MRQGSTASYRGRALLALVMGGGAIGCSPVLVKLSQVGPVATAFWRIALALLPLLFVSRSASNNAASISRPTSWSDRRWAALPGLFLGAELTTWHFALNMTSVANATLLINMTPISVAILGRILFRTTISKNLLIGLATAVAGVIVLKGGPSSIEGGKLAGDAVALLGSVIYAGYFLILGKVRARLATITVMRWSTFSAGLAVLPFALWLEPHFAPWTITGWCVVLALAWICHAGGQSLITFALAWLPPNASSLTLLVQPVVAALLAWAFLNEPLSAMKILGGLIVLAGILIARKN